MGAPEVRGYDELRLLGRGGFATVYRARQLAFDRDVALKVLDGSAPDERSLALFDRECRAAGSLSWHPHVVPVYDAGRTTHDLPFLAMELLPGGSLADVLDDTGPLGEDDVIRYATEVADALSAAHDADLLHRDVKPANVLVDRRGRARLADFGISRVVGSGSATTTGAVTGTMAYLAPEVLGGAKASAASDVYALGITMITLATGRNPFVEDTDDTPFAVIARVLSGERLVLPVGFPARLRPLVEACTDRDPAARPGAAADVLDALTSLPPAPSPVPPPDVPTRPEPEPRPVVPGPGLVTAAAARIPPPPTSAVRVRSDHTLAVPPPPPAPGAGGDDVDPETELVEYDLSEWPWGLERRLWVRVDDAGISFERSDGSLTVRREDEALVDGCVDAELAGWAEMQDAGPSVDRRLLADLRRVAERLRRSPRHVKAWRSLAHLASRFDELGAPEDVGLGPWRGLTLRVAELEFLGEEEDVDVAEVVAAAVEVSEAIEGLRRSGG